MKYREYSAAVDRPFNFAELLLSRLDRLFQAANESAVGGDSASWYRVLGALKRSISFVTEKDFKPEDKERIELLTKKLTLAKSKIKTALSSGSEALYFDVEKTLEEIEVEIVKIMYDNELYYPHYSRKPWQQIAEEEPT